MFPSYIPIGAYGYGGGGGKGFNIFMGVALTIISVLFFTVFTDIITDTHFLARKIYKIRYSDKIFDKSQFNILGNKETGYIVQYKDAIRDYGFSFVYIRAEAISDVLNTKESALVFADSTEAYACAYAYLVNSKILIK